MSGGKYLGFYYYRASFLPSELKLGNIVWDFKQPRTESPYLNAQDIPISPPYFDPQDWLNADFQFRNEREMSLALKVAEIATLGTEWTRDVSTHFASEKVNECHILLGKEDEFVNHVLSNPSAQAWLQLNLSAAYTVGSKLWRKFRRPKLWLCTGLVTADTGTFEVCYSGTRSGTVGMGDPTGTVPLTAELKVKQGPSSNRKYDISRKQVIGAQWMLLYGCNKQTTTIPSGPHVVKLTRKYAKDNVKGPGSVYTLLITDKSVIDRSETKGVFLIDASGEEEDDTDEHEGAAIGTTLQKEKLPLDVNSIFEPMFPARNSGNDDLWEAKDFDQALSDLQSNARKTKEMT